MRCWERLGREPDLAALPRTLVRDWADRFLDVCRTDIRAGRITDPAVLGLNALGPRLVAFVREGTKPGLRRVLNATGVVVHTNLGRSPLCAEALRAVTEAGAHYSNVELDLETGRRGDRHAHAAALLRRLTGAEAALVVNNNAAAVLLALDSLARGREVIVSRGELVEIGGSFRIPEVMAASGAVLREVGATNRTRLADYEQAIGPQTAALMKVHPSNYRIVGFVETTSVAELAGLGRLHGLPIIEDLGSGALFDFASLGMGGEPTVRQALSQGADLILFSGDKALGGPQAGVVVGRRQYVERLERNPLMRALRPDKLTLAALEATLQLYLDPDAARSRIPVLRMIAAEPGQLRRRARRLAAMLRRELGPRLKADIAPGESCIGGGAFPEQNLETTLVRLDAGANGLGPDALRAALLRADPPLVCRIEAGVLCLDPRTLDEAEFRLAVSAVAQALRIAREEE